MIEDKYSKGGESKEGTYHVNKPVEIEYRTSPRTIFIVLALLTRNIYQYYFALLMIAEKNNYCCVNPELFLYSM
jgi:hypothetical protein